MIKTIEIQNFQSHSHTILDLSSGVNVIKGRSHSGKSSIIRALRWALLNDERGDHFVSHFRDKNGETSVGIEFDDGLYIIRKRTSKMNGYSLPDQDLEAIRTDLPDEVKAISRMGEINIQSQDELYYMLKETPGTVARELNRLVGLDIIDETLSRLNKLENENSVRLKMLEKDSQEIEDGLEELDYVPDLDAKVSEIEDLWNSYHSTSREIERMSELSRDIEELSKVVDTDREWLTIKEPVAEINQLMSQLSEIEKSYIKLKKLYDDIRQAKVVEGHANATLSQLKSKHDQLRKSKEFAKEFCPKCGAHMAHWRKK